MISLINWCVYILYCSVSQGYLLWVFSLMIEWSWDRINLFQLKCLTVLLVAPQANKLRQVVRAKTSNFIRKASRAGRWCISVPKKCLAWVGMLVLSRFSHVRLCDPIDGSPPGSPVPGILQARTLEWVAISFSSAWKWKVKVKLLSCVQLLVTPWTVAH